MREPSFIDIKTFYYEYGQKFNVVESISEMVINIARLKPSKGEQSDEKAKFGRWLRENDPSAVSAEKYTYEGMESNILREVRSAITNELYEYSLFARSQFDSIFQKQLTKDGISEEETQEGKAYFVIEGGCKVKLRRTEIFIRKAKVFLETQRIYRSSTKIPNGKVRGHVFMPVVLDYLLALYVTSVNAERTFSILKRIYGDDKLSLSDRSAYSVLNINAIDKSEFDLDILKDVASNRLRKALRYKTRP